MNYTSQNIVLDYSLFGSAMPGRSFTGANKYRFGFNGKEKKAEGFALKTASLNGSMYYSNWAKVGVYNPKNFTSWAKAFNFVTNKTINSGGRISFELGGMNISKALAGKSSEFVGRYTSWELQQVTSSSRLWKNTDFYLKGVKQSSKQLKELGIKLKMN